MSERFDTETRAVMVEHYFVELEKKLAKMEGLTAFEIRTDQSGVLIGVTRAENEFGALAKFEAVAGTAFMDLLAEAGQTISAFEVG